MNEYFEKLFKRLDSKENNKELALEVSAQVYFFMTGIFEHLEATQRISGNGHCIAQKFSETASELVMKRSVDSTPEEKEKALENLRKIEWR